MFGLNVAYSVCYQPYSKVVRRGVLGGYLDHYDLLVKTIKSNHPEVHDDLLVSALTLGLLDLRLMGLDELSKCGLSQFSRSILDNISRKLNESDNDYMDRLCNCKCKYSLLIKYYDFKLISEWSEEEKLSNISWRKESIKSLSKFGKVNIELKKLTLG